jgi:hypothetical protein
MGRSFAGGNDDPAIQRGSFVLALDPMIEGEPWYEAKVIGIQDDVATLD